MRFPPLITFAALLPLVLPGCAHTHSRDTVILVDDITEGHACINTDEIHAGDKVVVSQDICTESKRRTGRRGRLRRICNEAVLGEAEVTGISGDHFAKLKAIGNLSLQPGLRIRAKN